MLNKVSPKDIFLHLLASVTLYVSAISFLTLLFQLINIGFPDAVLGDNFYRISAAYAGIRWSIATLIVVFPVYIWSSWFLNKNYQASPEKADLSIRKWLIYFTLFIAALIIIGDLVTLINTFLGGEVTVRFILKVLSVLFVTGSVFGYYLHEIRRYKT